MRQENNSRVLEIREDNPDAMAALLLYLYTGSYHNDSASIESSENMWKYHFEVSRVANKYLVSKLEQRASRSAVDLIERLNDMKDIVQFIKYLRTNGMESSSYFNLEDIKAKHQTALVREPEYRQLLETKTDLIWPCIYRLASSVPDATLVELACCRCNGCPSTLFLSPQIATPTNLSSFAFGCLTHRCRRDSVWVQEHEIRTFLHPWEESSKSAPIWT